MNSKTAFFLSLIIAVIFFSGCSEKDSTSSNGNDPTPPELALVPDLFFAFPDSADLIDFDPTEIEYGGEMVTAYSLDQFLDFERDNVPELEYTYEIVSDDGYSPRQGGNPDLTWEQFSTGYLLPTEKFRTFFPSEEIPTAYNVKYAKDINLYRTVIAVDTDGIEITFQTGAFTTEDVYHQAGNGQFYIDPGFSLTNFVSDYVTGNPEDYNYHFTASDDYTCIFSWEEIEAGWWLPDHNKAVFLNEDGTEFHSSFKFLVRIELAE